MENEIKKEENLPLVTLFIPSYNHERFILYSLQSAMEQSYENIELIIINDGSTDKSHELILSFEHKLKSKFKRYEYRNRENRGLTATLNEILSWSNGKYLTGVSSDDIMHKDKIKLLVELLETMPSEYAVAFGDSQFIDEHGEVVYIDNDWNVTNKDNGESSVIRYHTKRRNFNFLNPDLFGSYESILIADYLPVTSHLLRLNAMKEIGGWTEGNGAEDYEMWLKLSKWYKFVYTDKTLAYYRWHGENTASTKKLKLLLDMINLVLREKKYAYSNNMKMIWNKRLAGLITAYFKLSKSLVILSYLLKLNYLCVIKIILNRYK